MFYICSFKFSLRKQPFLLAPFRVGLLVPWGEDRGETAIFTDYLKLQLIAQDTCTARKLVSLIELSLIVLPVFWSDCTLNLTENILILYGKASLRQIRVLWLVLSRSGFCSTDRFHMAWIVSLFWTKGGKFQICYQSSKKKKCEYCHSS